MILDHGLQVAVCTPPKCGTTSLEKMARRRGPSVSVSGNGRHGCVMPAAYEGARYRRLTTCRHPWARLASVWRYVGSRGEEFAEGPAVREMTFPEFVSWWEARRAQHRPDLLPPWVTLRMKHLWYVTQGDFARRWRPEGYLRVESLAADLAAGGVDWGPEVRANTTDRVKRAPWWEHYDREAWDRVGELFAAEEAEMLGYATDPPGELGGATNLLMAS